MSTRRAVSNERPRERAALVHLVTRASRPADPDLLLDELAGLARAAGAEVVVRVVQERPTPDPATLIGRGKAAELARACDQHALDLVIVDNPLTPAQARNLEQRCERRVVDRTELILDIFARRARTHEGRLQVELAQLQYRLPRLAGSRDALSRLGGGIGTRGPGETKLETDRRRIRHRIAALETEIDDVRRRRAYLRTRRGRSDVPTVALVGYTNAGKTTLFNRLTGANAEASDALFVTLDPLMRRVKLPDARQILLTDTVGFLDRLPHQLVAAFHATLEEVAAADLLVVGAARVPMIDAFNKIDQLDETAIERLLAGDPEAVLISARQGTGAEALIAEIVRRLAMDVQRVSFDLDETRDVDRRLVADLYRHGHVLRHVTANARITIEAEVPRRWARRLARAKVPA
jgi:GTP-binding protein HflX